jgi:hypothetical protein
VRKIRRFFQEFCMLDDESAETLMPSAEWYLRNLDDMKTKIDDVLSVFPDGLETPVRIS